MSVNYYPQVEVLLNPLLGIIETVHANRNQGVDFRPFYNSSRALYELQLAVVKHRYDMHGFSIMQRKIMLEPHMYKYLQQEQTAKRFNCP